MSYATIEYQALSQRMDLPDVPYQAYRRFRLHPDETLIESASLFDAPAHAEALLRHVPQTIPYMKMFPRSPRGQYRRHLVIYPVVR